MNRLCGTWKLVSEELLTEKLERNEHQRPPARGYLTYTSDGFVFWIRSDAERAAFSVPDFQVASQAEKARAAESFRAYVGRYELHQDKVIHFIELSLFPNWAGTSQYRTVRLEGDQLELLSAPFQEGGKRVIGVLRFERVARGPS